MASAKGRTNMQKSADVIRPGTDSTRSIEESPDSGWTSSWPVVVAPVSGLPVSKRMRSVDEGEVEEEAWAAVGGLGSSCGGGRSVRPRFLNIVDSGASTRRIARVHGGKMVRRRCGNAVGGEERKRALS